MDDHIPLLFAFRLPDADDALIQIDIVPRKEPCLGIPVLYSALKIAGAVSFFSLSHFLLCPGPRRIE
ncbi:hypothetical protein, partial [Faecalibaculum rodentium]|uniref:hypothetical protein n=1 Tax=Faecalibaculum rodentium TaxID=1702221 RepID=UPI0025B7A28F